MKTYSRKKSGTHSDVIINLNELCRLCLSKEDELIPIFNEDDAVPLTLRIMACVSLEVFEGDGLPNMICHACKFQLEKSYRFKKKCENTDLKLRRHLKLIKEKLCKDDTSGDVTELLADLMSDDATTTTIVEADDTGKDSGESGKGEVEPMEEVDCEPSTEQDLFGARVAYLQPDADQQEEHDPEHITLPLVTDEVTKDACTFKKEIIELEDENDDNQDANNDSDEDDDDDDDDDNDNDNEAVEENSNPNIFELKYNEDHEPILNENSNSNSNSVIDQNDFSAIADAVKQTLASQPGLDFTGPLQIKLDQGKPGEATQIQVTTEDGSVIVMELLTEEEQSHMQPKVEEPDDDGELKVFQCPDCSKAFSRRIQLRRHASVHMQQRGFSCGICEKWFPTRSALIRHERIHTGERPFKCEVCQKSFAQKEILFRHLMTHTGQKPYNCPYCPKGFTQKEPLRIHMRTHTNPNPTDIQLHHCTLCPKVFCHASGLSRHLVTHTGKTFKCRDCDKSFTDKSSLRRHHKLVNHKIN